MYAEAIDSASTHLVKSMELEGPGSKRVTVIGDRSGDRFVPALDHLTCFSGAMIGLGARLLGRQDDLDLAISVRAFACRFLYRGENSEQDA